MYAIDRPWVIVLLNSMVVALILAIFEPFHYRLNSVIQFWVLWCFVGLTFIFSVVAFVLFPKLFKRFYDPERWTIGKNLLHNSKSRRIELKRYLSKNPAFCYFWDSLVSFMTITS